MGQADEVASHLDHISEEGIRFLECTTAPFVYDGPAPKIPDSDGRKTAALRLQFSGTKVLAAGITEAFLSVRITNDSAFLIFLEESTSTSADYSVHTGYAPPEWLVLRDAIAGGRYRVTALGIRGRSSGPESVQTGTFQVVETVRANHDATAYVSPDEQIAVAERLSDRFPVEKGMMSRMRFTQDWQTAANINSLADVPVFMGMFLHGGAATQIFAFDVILYLEAPIVPTSPIPTSYSPVDFHYDLLRAMALGSQSDMDHTADSLKSILTRLLEYGAGGLKGGVMGAIKTGTPVGAAQGALGRVGPMLISDLARLIPPHLVRKVAASIPFRPW